MKSALRIVLLPVSSSGNNRNNFFLASRNHAAYPEDTLDFTFYTLHFTLFRNGGEKGDRTLDLRLMSPALYQLSYLAANKIV